MLQRDTGKVFLTWWRASKPFALRVAFRARKHGTNYWQEAHSNMMASILKFAGKGFVVSLFLAGATLVAQQQHVFDGTWQMDPAQSKINDKRVVTLTIATLSNGIKVTMKTRKSDGPDVESEFTSKLDGKPCDFLEGTHKSQITVWYNGPTLNASKESGPADDKTAAWKLELGSDKGTMTMTINHYDPNGADETLVFKHSAT